MLTASAAGTYTLTATDSRGCLSPAATTTLREKGGDLTALVSPAGATDVLSPVTLNANGGLGLAYQWRKDGQDIARATAVSYVVNQSDNASYSVAVSRDGCSVASSPVAVIIRVPTALEPLTREAFELHLFPNPTSGLLRVEIHLARPEVLRLSLQDLTGRCLTQQQRTGPNADHVFELNLSALADGLYLLSAESESGWQSRKVLKSN